MSVVCASGTTWQFGIAHVIDRQKNAINYIIPCGKGYVELFIPETNTSFQVVESTTGNPIRRVYVR